MTDRQRVAFNLPRLRWLVTAYIPVFLVLSWVTLPGATAQTIPLSFSSAAPQRDTTERAEFELNLPGTHDLFLNLPSGADWLGGAGMRGEIILPAEAPAGIQLLVFLKDRDGRWFQALSSAFLEPGTNSWSFDFSADAGEWRPVGHHQVWNYRTRLNPEYVGMRVFANQAAYTGLCEVVEAHLDMAAESREEPVIGNLRANSSSVGINELFELSFDLPDRYANPFDPAEIDVAMELISPRGVTNMVHAFYFQDFFRVGDVVGDRLQVKYRPGWRVRYAPREEGEHSYRVIARDRHGETQSTSRVFTATGETAPGYIRAAADTRHFETDDDKFFFPIGHNIRSPFDTRMDEQFPWRPRHPGSSGQYREYFTKMSAAKQNFAEIWMCQWSLGLEWSNASPGYHGLGDYHLGNAWEMDEVLGWARSKGIRINLVLNNHGRVGLRDDAEWKDSPFNEERGGFLPNDNPLVFFEDERAIELQKQLYRYIVARWGWDSTIFAWELWSELDLTGRYGDKPVPQRDPRVIEWHRIMGDYIKEIDLGRHMVSTHLSGDYRVTGPELANIPQLDLCGIDAYHSSQNPLHIVNLVHETAVHYHSYKKPVLITEFGGSAMAAGFEHLRKELHAAIWSSLCVPLGGVPLFWWWQLIDEQNLYPMYTAAAKFMEGVDRRGSDMDPVILKLSNSADLPVPESQIGSIALGSQKTLLAWVFIRPAFARGGQPLAEAVDKVEFVWVGCSNAVYRASFHDTASGDLVRQQDIRGENQRLTISFPPINQDMALKLELFEYFQEQRQEQ